MHKRYMTLTLWVSLLVAIAILAACGGTAAPVEVDPPQPSPTSPATQTPEPTPETSPVAEASGESGRSIAFTLVPEESVASYAVDEIFIDDDNKLVTAVGTTSVMTGSLSLDYHNPAASQFGQFTVDISKLKSDRSRRDRAIRTRWLESLTYPLATFEVLEVRDFPADPQEGIPLVFQLAGEMTLKETTRDAIWDVTAMLDGDTLSGSATTFIMLEDYNIPVPSILNILKVTDGMTLKLDFLMTEGDP